jgi:hypothetical protein
VYMLHRRLLEGMVDGIRELGRGRVQRTRSVHFIVPTKIRESVVWMRRVLLRRWCRYSVASALVLFIVCCVSMIVIKSSCRLRCCWKLESRSFHSGCGGECLLSTRLLGTGWHQANLVDYTRPHPIDLKCRILPPYHY